MIVLNFKTYPQVTLENKAVELAKLAQEVYDKYQVPIILCVQATDIYQVCQAVSLPVYAQHVDPIEPGQHTGFISPLAIKVDGATGVLLNHSEHRLPKDILEKTILLAKQAGLQILVSVENAEEAVWVDTLQPDAIALEDPVLIGGDQSIVENEAGKQKVKDFVAQNIQAQKLVGAGVKDQADVRESLQLGAVGVLLASGFVKATDPRMVLEDLCLGFK